MWYLFKMPGSAPVMAGLSIDKVREILAQMKEGVEVDVDFAQIAEENEAAKNVGVEEEPEYESVGGEDELTRFDSKIKSGKRNKRGGKGRDRDRRGGGDRPQGQGQQGPRAGGEGQGARPQQGPRPPRPDRPQGQRPPRPDQPQGPRPPRQDQQPRGDRPTGDRPQGDRPPGEGGRNRNRRGRDRRGPRPDRPQGGGDGGGPSTPPAA